MKTIRIFTLCFLLMTLLAGAAQSVNPPYEVGIWPGFRSAAVSFTFDDICRNQFDVAIPMFNEFGYHLTLFVPTQTDWLGFPDWEKCRNAASQGHEVASHTLTHTTFAGMSDSVQTIELKESRDEIDANIPGETCITMAYPYCATGNRPLCSEYYLAARICSGAIEKPTPRDFMAISSFVCGTEGSTKTADNFLARAETAARSNGWAVYLLHGIDDDGGWSPVTSEVLRETLEKYRDNDEAYWIETFGNVVKYIKERDAVSVTETSVQDSMITIQVTDTLNNEIFDMPVTLRRPMPEGWASVAVEQNGQPVETQIVDMDTVRYIQFDVIPDSGDLILHKTAASSVQSHSGVMIPSPFLARNYPNPFNPATTIQFDLTRTGPVTLEIFDLSGKEVITLLNKDLSEGRHSVVFNAGGLASGVYFYSLKTQGFSQYRKMLLLQ